MMKNCSYICSVLDRDILTLMSAGILISAYIEHRNLGLPILNDFCTVRSEIVPVKNRGRYALFLYPYYNFSFMTGTMKNRKSANNSSIPATSAHDTGDLLNFVDLYNSLLRKFEVEKSAKNKAYAFIISGGHLSEFAKFLKTSVSACDTLENRIALTLKSTDYGNLERN